MQVFIRLYRRYDLDLINLAKHEDFSITRNAKLILNSFVSGEVFRLPLPKVKAKSPFPETTSTYTYNFKLNDEKDKEVCDLLKRIKNGQRNSFLKNLIRSYMASANISAYFDDDEISEQYYAASLSSATSLQKAEKKEKLTGTQIADRILSDSSKKTENLVEESTKKIDNIDVIETQKDIAPVSLNIEPKGFMDIINPKKEVLDLTESEECIGTETVNTESSSNEESQDFDAFDAFSQLLDAF